MKLVSAARLLRGFIRRLREHFQLMLAQIGLRQSEARIAQDAQNYWTKVSGAAWMSNSHWRGGAAFAADEDWMSIGAEHLRLFDRFARAVQWDRPLRSVVEWGCGGGANAIHFARRAETYVGVDVAPETLDECARQLASFSDTNFVPVLAGITNPEEAVARIPRPCDLFLCLYVLELVPTPEYGLRLMRIASQILVSGGLALVQIKYNTGARRTQPRRRGYTADLANMTTYRIDEFWTAIEQCGLKAELVSLVPHNPLDERYAYFLLSKQDA